MDLAILGRSLAQVGDERLNAAQPEQDPQDRRRVFYAPAGIEGRDVCEAVRGQSEPESRQSQEDPLPGAKASSGDPVLRDQQRVLDAAAQRSVHAGDGADAADEQRYLAEEVERAGAGGASAGAAPGHEG